MRAKAQYEARIVAEKTRKNEWIGVVGEKIKVNATVERVIDREGDYGMTYITTLVTDAGETLTWFATSVKLDVGQKYSVKGTIKALGEYKGVKQTTLTRCKCEAIA